MKKNNEDRKAKNLLHPRNSHKGRYDLKALTATCPELSSYIIINEYGDDSIKFSDPKSVLVLNKALLQHHYGVKSWSIPAGFLCPPVPGRADYVHYIADLLASCNKGVIPTGSSIKSLDIGVGANCIYPIIGNFEYGWSFVGSDIESLAIDSSKKIVKGNPSLQGKVELRLQKLSRNFFQDIIQDGECFDFTICNPPFNASQKDADEATLNKVSNLNKEKTTAVVRNFGGQNNELCYPGGEVRFVKNMVEQSKEYANSCFWFTSLLSKKDSVRPVKVALKKAGAVEIRTVSMNQGSKTSRFIAWTFLSVERQKAWRESRW